MRMSEAERSAAGFLMVGFDGPTLPEATGELLGRGAFGAILFARNFVDRRQVAELCAAIKDVADRPIAIAVDHEGGRVQRFRGSGFTETQPMRDLGRNPEGAEDRARALGQLFAAELRPLGIDIDFAPVLDVDSNPANPVIGERSFSSDPQLVARLGAAFVEGLQEGGVAACGKHFPGHGDTDRDSHLDLPRLSHDVARLKATELVPFQAAIHARVACVMTSHILFTALDSQRPATMSKRVLSLLRDELKYGGVVVSDDLEMKAIAEHFPLPGSAVDAVLAGCDLLLVCHTLALQQSIIETLARAILDGSIPADRVLDAEVRRANLARRFVR
ncbi:MAG: beta-N-acetylhexosaminidase [Phycisphaerales bacterium]